MGSVTPYTNLLIMDANSSDRGIKVRVGQMCQVASHGLIVLSRGLLGVSKVTLYSIERGGFVYYGLATSYYVVILYSYLTRGFVSRVQYVTIRYLNVSRLVCHFVRDLGSYEDR